MEIGSFFSAFASLLSGILQKQNIDTTNATNRKLYEDWKAYNTPAAQMDRLRDAGLNPYMVNGVTNTLSSPFQISQNNGLAQGMQDFAQSVSQGVSQSLNAEDIRNQNKIRQDRLELDRLNYQLRKRMTEVNIKKGNAMAALLWSQGTIADLNATFWRHMADVRENKFISEATIAAANADFLQGYNPMRLNFYSQYLPGQIASQAANTAYTRARTSNIFWNQAFQREMFERTLAQRMVEANQRYKLGLLNNELGWMNADTNAALGLGRLDLQRDYYSLANAKWLTGLGMDFIKLPTFFKPKFK